MPVKKGTNPIKAKGRALCIDGGLAKAYQKTTGIAGYSLIQNSYGFILSAHEPFESKEKAIRDELDIFATQVAKNAEAAADAAIDAIPAAVDAVSAKIGK